MCDQHALHRGLTTHFKIPKKTVPKSAAQVKASVHQTREEELEPLLLRRRLGRLKFPAVNRGSHGWLCPVLAEPTRQVLVIQDPAFWCPVGVGVLNPSGKDTHTVSNEEQEGVTGGRRRSAGEGGHRACPKELLPGLLQQTLPSSKENWWVTSSHRSVHAQQASGSPSFPDGGNTVCQGSYLDWRVGTVHRHPQCISPCSNESSSAEISMFLHQSSHLWVHLSSIQSDNIS